MILADIVSEKKRSEMMSRVRSKNTQLEMDIRRCLWKDGYRYRIHYGEFKIDIAFPGRKVAIFLDSCFWHFCPLHGSIPKTRASFWKKKLEDNRERDRVVTQVLTDWNWLVLRFWEHEIQRDFDGVVCNIEKTVAKRTIK
jgi:DNA mismatch endonuclease, patch repair protein